MSRGGRPRLAPTAALVLLVPLLACGDSAADDAPMDMPAETPAAAPESAELTALREKFDPFQEMAQAQAAGYGTAITSCWYHRDNGGQGVHYARQELIDGTLSAMDPEIVMYEPQADGSLDLLAVEYIVPFDAWTSAEPPSVLGQALHRNEALSLWVLHVWLWRDNPSGLYSDWNPTVSCQNAAESEDRAGA